MDLGAVLSLAGPTVIGLVVAAPREDPAQDDLRLVIISLLAMAAVLSVLTLVFWRATRPAPAGSVARRGSRDGDDVTVREVPAPSPAPVYDEVRSAWAPPAGSAAAPRPPAASPERVAVGSPDAPWPPPRVPRLGSARPPRPADDPDSLFGRLAALPDLDPVPAPRPAPSRPPQDAAAQDAVPRDAAPQDGPADPEGSSSGRPTRSTSRS